MFYGLSTQWPFNPGVLLFLLALAVLYQAGILATRRKIQRFNATQQEREKRMPVRARHIVSFYVAIAFAALVTLTPIDTIARTQLFTIHIAQLVLLTTFCTPLILFGCPEDFLKPFIEVPVVRPIVRTFTQPLVASIIFNLSFLLWHTPLLLHAAIENNTLYNVQILSIFIASFLNWWPLIGTVHEVRKMSYPLQILFAFFDGQPVDILAFVLVFTEVSIYPYYNIPATFVTNLSIGGLTPFGDQAAGGALLLIPGLVDFVVMTPLFFKWFGLMEKRTRLADEHRLQSAGDGYSYGEDYDDDEEEYEDDEIEEHVAFDGDR